MYCMGVIYYYFYLFYRRILKDNEPHLLTVLALSFLESLVLIAIIDSVLIYFFCIDIDKTLMFIFLLLIVGANYFVLFKSGWAKHVVNAQPRFLKSKWLSAALVIFSFLITVSIMFWGPIYLKIALDEWIAAIGVT